MRSMEFKLREGRGEREGERGWMERKGQRGEKGGHERK
jgi:hypothetical protein